MDLELVRTIHIILQPGISGPFEMSDKTPQVVLQEWKQSNLNFQASLRKYKTLQKDIKYNMIHLSNVFAVFRTLEH